MKLINTNRSKNKKNINIFVLFFILLSISGIILTTRNSEKTNKIKEEEITISDLKRIASDSTIKNIDINYKILKSNSDSIKTEKLAKNTNYYADFYKMLSIITILLFLLLLGLYIYKKGNKFKTNDNMGFEILGRRYLGQKQYLALVKIKKSELLLGVTDNSINLIKEYPNNDNESITKETDKTDDFPKILKKLKNND